MTDTQKPSDTYTIAPLEWVGDKAGGVDAHTAFGIYTAAWASSNIFHAYRLGGRISTHPTMSAAKAACEADHQTRMKAALVPAESPWRDISTNKPPEDGTKVDLWHEDDWRLPGCYFKSGDWLDVHGCRLFYGALSMSDFTHWMHFPAPGGE